MLLLHLLFSKHMERSLTYSGDELTRAAKLENGNINQPPLTAILLSQSKDFWIPSVLQCRIDRVQQLE